MTVKVNGNEYAATIFGTHRDIDWGNRDSKSIKLTMDYATAVATFVDDVPWSILYQPSDYYDPETQQMVTPPVEEYDNSDYCILGDITDNSDYCILGDITVHRDGTVTVKMGKPTGEELYNILREAMQG